MLLILPRKIGLILSNGVSSSSSLKQITIVVLECLGLIGVPDKNFAALLLQRASSHWKLSSQVKPIALSSLFAAAIYSLCQSRVDGCHGPLKNCSNW